LLLFDGKIFVFIDYIRDTMDSAAIHQTSGLLVEAGVMIKRWRRGGVQLSGSDDQGMVKWGITSRERLNDPTKSIAHNFSYCWMMALNR
jgi:hypothetical protein